MHFQAVEELYQASWRPTPIDVAPQFPPAIPPAPEPSESVKGIAAVSKPTPSKPAGAYRPPGARGSATPSIYKREDEGGAPSGTSTPSRGYNRSPVPGAPVNGYVNGQNGDRQQRNGRRHVPGAPHSPSPGPDGDKAKNRKKKTAKKEGGEEQGQGQGGERARREGGQGQGEGQGAKGGQKGNGNRTPKVNGKVPAAVAVAPPPPTLSVETDILPTTPGLDSALDPTAKKIRNLTKKVCLSSTFSLLDCY